jgi:hypothetical protein
MPDAGNLGVFTHNLLKRRLAAFSHAAVEKSSFCGLAAR